MKFESSQLARAAKHPVDKFLPTHNLQQTGVNPSNPLPLVTLSQVNASAHTNIAAW